MENQTNKEEKKKWLMPILCGIALLLLIAALLLGLRSCNQGTDNEAPTQAPDAPTEPSVAAVLEKINILTYPTKSDYFPGEALDTTGLTLNAFYSDGTRMTITEGFTCDPTTMTELGVHPITVYYEGKQTSFHVTVKEPSITGLTISTLPNKTSYFTGDTLDTTGLTLIATYDDGTQQTITEGFTCSPTKLTSVGTRKINVEYGGRSTSFEVTVTNVELLEISIATLPNKTSYYVGDILIPDGLSLIGTYSDGTKSRLPGYTISSPQILSTPGAQTVTVEYGGKYATYEVTVKEVVITSIVLATRPNKTAYMVGDTLDTSGITIQATYNNGSRQIIPEGFTFTPTTLSTPGTQTITIEYGGLTTTYKVTVEEVVMTGVAVATAPNKTTYFMGDILDTTGLTLTATYSDGSTKTVTSGFSCYTTELSTAGIHKIGVVYGNKVAYFEVTVKVPELTGIFVKNYPVKTTYYVGDTLDTASLIVGLNYNDGSVMTISSGFSCTPTKLSTAGTQKITVSYGGKSTSFNVTVNEVKVFSIFVATNPSKTTYFVGDTLNTSGLTLTATYNNGTKKTVSSGFTCTPTKLSTAGTQKITVSYGDKTTSFTVTVKNPEVTGISVKTMPNKTTYFLGDRLDTTGLTFTVSWNNGTTTTIQASDPKLDYYPTEMDQIGSRNINVFYGSVSTLFRVQVKDPIIGSGTCGDNLTWELTGSGILTIRGSGAMYDYGSNKAPWRFKSDFLDSGKINQINLPEGLTHIGSHAFYACYGYSTIKIPSSIQTIGSYAFAESTTLKELTIPDSVISLGYSAFRGSYKLETLKFGKGLKTLGAELFARCGGLRSVWVDPENQHFAHTSNGALFTKDMKALIVFPRNIPGKYVMPDTVETIWTYAFQYCHLTEVVLPSSLKKISSSAFLWCDTITSITIPANVQEIGIHAFQDCEGLTKIYVLNPNCTISTTYDDTLGMAEKVTVYGYADSTTEAYCQKYGYSFVAI